MNLRTSLEQIGLTKTEAKVYLELFKLGSTKSGPLVRKTELHRATVYDVLKRLLEKGLASYIIREKTKYFETSSPEHLLDVLEEEKKEAEKKEDILRAVVKNLEKMKQNAITAETANIFVGKRGAKTVFEDILNYKENWVIGSSGKFLKIMGSYFYQFQKRKKERKIHTKLIASERVIGTEVETSVYGEKRFIPKEYESPVSTIIYGNKVATFIWLENPITFLIESKEAAESYRNYYMIMWNSAKR
ncbi:hypothetical protein J4401_04925 [Candidatus Woesearchaeota archaeon]|nr:hypothetical protein [Candidatus Woesearchaeota archaeon]